MVPFPAQSNDPTCTSYGCNIERICWIVTQQTKLLSPLQSLAALANGLLANGTQGDRGRGAVTQGGEGGKRVTAVEDGAEDAEDRGGTAQASPRSLHDELDYWGYQTCTEVRYNCPYRLF